jgi:glutaminyl-peptide cyclotransferase
MKNLLKIIPGYILTYLELFIFIMILSSSSCNSDKNKSEDRRIDSNIVKNTAKQSDSQQTDKNKKDYSKKDYTYQVVRTFWHDPTAYTQGLIYYNGYLFESTGLRRHSSLRKLDPKTGKILKIYSIPGDYFAEGITIMNGKIYQLTWETRTGFVYDLETFDLEKTFTYFGEGWGLTNNKDNLIMSNGSNELTYLNPENFQIESTTLVYDGNNPIGYLNELEMIDGIIFANVYQTDKIVMINPESGIVVGWLDLSGLRDYIRNSESAEVLNGIAYNKENKTLFITGKNWPLMFEIKIHEKD